MFGVKHTKNSYNKFGEINEICIPYIADLEKRFKKNKFYRLHNTRSSDAQMENNHRSHLWRMWWYVFCHCKLGRKRKQCIRKIYKYWNDCPDAWGEYNYDFLNFDLNCPWPMYATKEVRSLSGNPVVFPKIKDIILKNQMALSNKQNTEFITILANARMNRK